MFLKGSTRWIRTKAVEVFSVVPADFRPADHIRPQVILDGGREFFRGIFAIDSASQKWW